MFIWPMILIAAAHVSLFQNESYQQNPEKTKNNGEPKKRDNINTLSLFTNDLYTYNYTHCRLMYIGLGPL